MYSDLTFKVSQLRSKNQIAMTTAVAVMVAALFITALLPSLMVRYYYAGQQLLQEPVLLQYIPLVSFIIGVGYFLFALVTNLLRAKRANYLENQISKENCCGDSHAKCCSNHDHDSADEMIEEMESLSDSLSKRVAPKKTSRSASKTSTRKTAKKK